MATRRAVSDDPEMERLRQGDISGARGAYRRKQVETGEAEALRMFFTNHPEIAHLQANESILLTEARSYGAVITVPLLDLALRRVASSLAMRPAAPTESTPEELATAERKRLLNLSLPELHDEIRKKNATKRIPSDVLSPEIAALKTKGDIQKLSASEMRRLLYRGGDRSIRRLNAQHIERIVNGN